MLELIILSLSISINLLVGLVVFIKNPHSVTSRIFALLTIGLSGWSSVSFMSLQTETQQLFLIRLTMFFVVLMNSAFFFLVQVFPNVQHVFTKRLKLFALYCIVTLGVTLSPFLFTGLTVGTNGSIAPIPGPGMLFFLFHALVCVIGAPAYLFVKYRKAKGSDRDRLRYLVIGTMIMFTLLPISNFIFPLVFGNSTLLFLSPLYTVIFDVCIAYAIVKHKLFDIRSAVARALTYFLTLGFFAVIYTIFIFGVSILLFDLDDLSLQTQIVYTTLALLLAFSFQSIKRFFDKLSNGLFFQDAYDTQEFLNDFNEILVEKVELEPLLSESTLIIKDRIKANQSLFIIRDTAYFPVRFIGDRGHLPDNAHDILNKLCMHYSHKVISIDSLSGEDVGLKKYLDKNDIAIVVRLVPTLEYEVEGVGYLLMGPKRSGEPYNDKDLQVLEIIANELVIAIENGLKFEEIDKFNITLQNKIDTATKELQRTNKKLEALDETKDEFISMASHQLRTPLTSVKGYLSMVLEGDAGELNDNQRKLLEQSFVSSQRMVYLIADLLNLSRLRTGKFVIETHPTNLAEVVEGEMAQLKDTAASRNLKLSFEKPKEFTTLMLDETKIRQVIMNFTDNAIYYTPSGGEIVVALRETAESIEFTVTDNGIGVPKKEQQHLFSKFYRAGNAKKARPDGTGLGLFMAKKVIVAQGGALIFKSQEGKGSTFGFSFAKKKLLPPVIHTENQK